MNLCHRLTTPLEIAALVSQLGTISIAYSWSSLVLNRYVNMILFEEFTILMYKREIQFYKIEKVLFPLPNY